MKTITKFLIAVGIPLWIYFIFFNPLGLTSTAWSILAVALMPFIYAWLPKQK